MNITTKHPEYLDMQDRWDMCDATSEGEHGVHEEGEKYLPRLQDETNEAYEVRKKMTPFFNAVWRTISGLRGMLFRKPPIVEVPAAVEELLIDIDLAGTPFNTQLQQIAEEVLTFGRVGLMADYPAVPEGTTRADAAAMNARPFIKLYDAESIYNWREDTINGVKQLTRVQLLEEEEVQDPANEFKVTCEKRYRILDLDKGAYRQRVFTVKGEEGVLLSEVYPKMNGVTMSFIPFIIIGTDDIGADMDAPPLIDLVTTNLHHYQQATSYERGCFFSGLPTMFISGTDSLDADGNPVEISIGGAIANILPRPEARAYFVEVAGEFNALRTNLEDKKREMAVLGARMLEQQKATVESADTIARRQYGEESTLVCIGMTLSIGVTKALQWLCDWAGARGEVKVRLNSDFLPAGMTSQDITTLVSAWQQGAISGETLFDNLKAGEIIGDVSYEEEQERIAGASMSLMQGQDSEPLPAEPQAIETAPAIDMQPLFDALTTIAQNQAILSEAMAAMGQSKSEPEESPMDTAPMLIEALRELGAQNSDALAAILAEVSKPVEPASVTVNAPINIQPPTINMPEQPITVNAGDVNVPAASVTVNVPEQPAQNITVNNMPPEGKKAITVERDASGKIIGATAE